MAATGTSANPFLGSPFMDLDDLTFFNSCLGSLTKSDARNFAVGFNAERARCQVNLQPDELARLIDVDNEDGQVRWLNFWSWDPGYKSALDKIAQKYKISPRLMGLIWPGLSTNVKLKSTATSSSNSANGTAIQTGRAGNPDPSLGKRERFKQYFGIDRPKQPQVKRAGFGTIAENLWHFCSVDSGSRYIHVGNNQLFVPPVPADTPTGSNPDKPIGLRIWTSILLCEDGTVISVFERPPPNLRNNTAVLSVLRRNVVNIFQNLSRLHTPAPEEALHQVSIRPQQVRSNNSNLTDDERKERQQAARIGMASLLFYYLFDDWYTSYALVSGGDHPYRTQLDKVRNDMFNTANVESVHSLHAVGRQLGVLKLIYQSYELIVNRIIEGQRLREDLSQSVHPPRLHLGTSMTLDDLNADINLNDASSHGSRVKLSMASIVRFERLLDRIRLYALTEIENCLKEKEELVFMNFNLVSLNESQAVEKLTRTTILLAKVTVLFLPISLTTSYFGISIGDIQQRYSLTTYWLTFLIVVVATLAFLVSFGLVSYKVSDGLGYTSFAKWLWDKSKNRRKKQQQEVHALANVPQGSTAPHDVYP